MKYKESFYNIKVSDYLDRTDIEDGLVYNTMSNKFGIIPNKIPNNPSNQSVQDGFYVDYEMNEAEDYHHKQVEAISDDYPEHLFFTIAVSSKCFYHCPYCFQGNNHDSGVDMEGEVLENAISFIKREIDRNKNIKMVCVRWFGGEPLTDGGMEAIRAISKSIIPFCENKGIYYSSFITTNGYNFTPEVSAELKGYKVKKAEIAIDGLEEDYINTRKAPHDAFERVIYNIENSEIKVGIRINLFQGNKEKLQTIVNYLMTLKSVQEKRNYIYIARVLEYSFPFKYGFTDKEWIEYRENKKDLFYKLIKPKNNFELKHLPCDVLQKRNRIINSDGLLYRCDNQIGKKEYAIGTVKDGYNEDNVNDKVFVRSSITDECLKCKLLPICCGGKCRYSVLKLGKNCELINDSFRLFLEYVLNHRNKHFKHSRLPLKR